MSWSQYQRRPQIAFRMPAPADAPEIKGYRAYFRPEQLEWVVRADEVRVTATGPTTRAPSLGQGEMWWGVEGRVGDSRPPWLPIPAELIAAAKQAVEVLDQQVLALWGEATGQESS